MDEGPDRGDRRRLEVCPAEELPPGSRTIVEVDGREIGVFNVDGEFHAIRNVCPHQLAPLAEGVLTGEMTAPAVGEYELVRQDRIIRCPWHGWQFDLATGESVFNPHVRTGTYDVAVETVRTCCDADAEERVYGAELAGEEPPVDTYEVAVEPDEAAGSTRSVVVLYV